MLSKRQITSTIYMVIAILTSGYALVTTKYSPTIYLSCAVGMAIFSLRTFNQTGRIETKKLRIALLILSMLLLPAFAGLSINATTENAISLFKLALALTFGATLFLSFDFRDFQNYFSNVMLAICAISLVGYALTNFTDLLKALPVITNVNNAEYKFALAFISYDGFLKYRNIGVFWEPGIFSTMIFCALVADLYSQKKANTLKTTIFLVALASTFSGAGLILFAIYVALVISRPLRQSDNNSFIRILPIFAVILTACIAGLYVANSQSDGFFYLERLAGKLTDPEETQSTRFLSPLTSLQVFFERPILGWGLTSALEEYKILNDEIALTSTSTYLMSAIGIFGALFTIVPIFAIAKYTSLNLISRGLLIFAFLFIINKEPHVYFALSYALVFFSLAASLKPKISIRKGKLDQIPRPTQCASEDTALASPSESSY